MKTVLVSSVLSLAISSAFATGTHNTPTPEPTPAPTIPNMYVLPSSSALAGAGADAAAGIDANIIGKNTNANENANTNTSAATGTATSSNAFNSNARSYSLVSSGSATPLPPGLCPKGDSLYVQILFGVLTWSTSSTRTEMECLDKVLESIRLQTQPVVVQTLRMEPGEQPHPVCTPDKKAPPVTLPNGKKRPRLTCERWIKKD